MNETLETEPFDLLVIDDGFTVEVRRPKEKARQGVVIHECKHCGYSGRAEIGRLPRPATRAAQFCPACRGAAR